MSPSICPRTTSNLHTRLCLLESTAARRAAMRRNKRKHSAVHIISGMSSCNAQRATNGIRADCAMTRSKTTSYPAERRKICFVCSVAPLRKRAKYVATAEAAPETIIATYAIFGRTTPTGVYTIATIAGSAGSAGGLGRTSSTARFVIFACHVFTCMFSL